MKKGGLDFVPTCSACPEQYDVFDGEKQVGYVRLRHGVLRADFPDCGGETIYTASTYGDGQFADDSERHFHLFQIARRIRREIEITKGSGN